MNNPFIIIFNGFIDALGNAPMVAVWAIAILFFITYLKTMIKEIITHWHGSKAFSTSVEEIETLSEFIKNQKGD